MPLIIYPLLLTALFLPGTAEAYLDPAGASLFYQLLLPVLLLIVGLPALFLFFVRRRAKSIYVFFTRALARRKS